LTGLLGLSGELVALSLFPLLALEQQPILPDFIHCSATKAFLYLYKERSTYCLHLFCTFEILM
jgi:hypothetical protein